MTPQEFLVNENSRRKEVEKYQLLDTPPEENYDNITELTSYICSTPIALITLVDSDRNYLKSHHGLQFRESPRANSFCEHAINSNDIITSIEDTRIDERFKDNPLVLEHNIVFYAGVPMVNPKGFKLGTLCVFDHKPRKLTSDQKKALVNLSRQVVGLFEERYKNIELQKLQISLKQRNKNLEKFVGVVFHDLKSPLAQIKTLTELLEQDIKHNLGDETKQYLEYIKDSSDSLRGYIDRMLNYYKTEYELDHNKSWVIVPDLIEEVQNMFKGEKNVTFNVLISCKKVQVNKFALSQVFVNLITNAIKHNNKTRPIVNIRVTESKDYYQFSIEDNGPGIPLEMQEKVFELLTTTGLKDKEGNMGTRIGLATVKKLITQLGGEITLKSKSGQGCCFKFCLRKT